MSAAPGTLRWQHVHTVPRFELESGAVLRDLRQAYYLDGALAPERDNVVVLFHALTGSADAAGSWWRELIGPGRALDTRHHAVLCANLLGSCYGSSGPSDYPPGEFPAVTPRDMARFTALLLDELGIDTPLVVAGGSLGGMVAQEWAATFPGRTQRVVVLAAPAAHTAHAIALGHIQRALLDTGPRGIELARQVAMLSFRTDRELGLRFGRDRDDAGRWGVAAYLDHQGRKLARRFDAATYRTLLDAMDAHDVGRDRGGVERALGGLADRITAVGVPGDQLYSAAEVRGWAEACGAAYRELQSVHGHDAFLLEAEQVGAVLRDALDAAAREAGRESPASLAAEVA
jgi:homoserine O-acetyltransferase